MEHTTDYKMYKQDIAIKIVNRLDIDMSWVQDPKDVQTDRCAIALLEHNGRRHWPLMTRSRKSAALTVPATS